MNIKNEWITCAALHYDDGIEHANQPDNIATGIVVCGLRHGSCYAIMAGLLGNFSGKFKVVGREAQGFLTSKNRYVTRAEAYLIAREQGQIIHNFHGAQAGNELCSEDLY